MTDIRDHAQQLRAHLGRRGEPVTVEVERGALRKFAVATGDPHPEHHGDLAAPTYVAALRAPLPDLPQPDAPFRVHLHTNDEIHLQEAIRPGDVLTTVAELTDVFVKEGADGPLLFYQMTFRTHRGDVPVSTVAWTEVMKK